MNPEEIEEWIERHVKPLARRIDRLDLKEWEKKAVLEKLITPYYYWRAKALGKRGIPERGYVPPKIKEELPPRGVGLIKERICASCGKEIESSDKFTTIDGKHFHWECFEKEYV